MKNEEEKIYAIYKESSVFKLNNDINLHNDIKFEDTNKDNEDEHFSWKSSNNIKFYFYI